MNKTYITYNNKNHYAINFGQTLELLWEEIKGDEDGFVVFPCGGPSKKLDSFDHEHFGNKYFWVPSKDVVFI